jgi:alpha-ketoglutarate-dependent taurine dioxygenase
MTTIQVAPVTPRTGAVISGVRLGGDLDASVVAEIRRALLRHKVVFFRGQTQLDEASQVAFAGQLGALTRGHPTQLPFDGHPHILNLSADEGGRAAYWHTDVTFTDRPPAFSVLRGVVIPPVGGDTLWANTATGYAGLKPEVREQADRLWAVHTNDFDYGGVSVRSIDELPEAYRERARQFVSTGYETQHPLVRVHPETLERTLLLGGFTRYVLGVSRAESDALIAALQAEITRPENTARWRWAAGDVAIWDNRATQHYAVNDFGDAPRVVRRATVAGDVPVAIDGRRSRSVRGDASAYSPVVAPVPA